MAITLRYTDAEQNNIEAVEDGQVLQTFPNTPGNRHFTQYVYQDDGSTMNPIEDYVEPDPSMAELKAHLATYRWQHEVSGINVQVNGYNFDVDTGDRSQTKMIAILFDASTDPTFTTPFKNKAGVFITLNADESITMARAVGAHVKKAFASEEIVLAAIDADPPTVTTYAQVEAAYDTAYAS